MSDADLALMRRMDELHLDHPFAGSRMLQGLLKAEGHEVGRLHVATPMKKMGIEALEEALACHGRPDIFNTDQGSQDTSVAFGLRCKEAGLRPSMGSVGDAYDDAMCESVFATPECELLDRRKVQTKAEGPAWPSSRSSRAGIIPPGAIPPSATTHPSTAKGAPKRGWSPQALNCPPNRGNSSRSKRAGGEALSFRALMENNQALAESSFTNHHGCVGEADCGRT